jgi:hypothetical protein
MKFLKELFKKERPDKLISAYYGLGGSIGDMSTLVFFYRASNPRRVVLRADALKKSYFAFRHPVNGGVCFYIKGEFHYLNLGIEHFLQQHDVYLNDIELVSKI